MKHPYYTKNNKGYTLTELMVAMSVFLVAITVAVGAFIQALKAQRAVNNLLQVSSNASLALELFSREIRTGFNFRLNNLPQGSCAPPFFEELEFTNSEGNTVFYNGEGGVIARKECAGADCSSASFESITAPNVVVKRLCFTNTGDLANNKDPWRITTVLAVGSSDPSLEDEVLNLQTTVSGRILPQDL